MAETALVRRIVRELLVSAPAYARLPGERQQRIAQDMVSVATYMADPHGLVSREVRSPLLTRRPTRKANQRNPADAGPRLPRDSVDVVLGELSRVDFPSFVTSLIQGSFGAIVNASLQQMDAYSRLLADVAKTVDAFRQDAVSESQTRDDLAARYPGLLCRGTGARRALRWCDDAAASARALQAALHLPEPPADLRQLVTAARRRQAVQRQQILATMVMMGIHRIVVTDGRLAAKGAALLKSRHQAPA